MNATDTDQIVMTDKNNYAGYTAESSDSKDAAAKDASSSRRA